jgi:hypothetical protein
MAEKENVAIGHEGDWRKTPQAPKNPVLSVH